jgi:hypothetical protein
MNRLTIDARVFFDGHFNDDLYVGAALGASTTLLAPEHSDL